MTSPTQNTPRTEAEARASSERIIAMVIAQRSAARLGVRVTHNDGSPDFTGYFRTPAERDDFMTRANRCTRTATVEII